MKREELDPLNETSLSLSRRILDQEADTIAAISTPFGESGIGIVRLSGSLAETIIKKLFKPKKNQSQLISHYFHYGEILDPRKGTPLDEVLVVLMRSPKTYTREDIVEIHCHGGYLILQKTLELVLNQGARMAEPGEFTKRAFLNGRIDLTQAEAVVDMIKAKTLASLEIANQQLKGTLHHEMDFLKGSLVQYLALIEAHIDFPEEEMEPISLGKMKQDIVDMIQKLEEWIESYEEGRIFREGISCAIIGKTNVGKSSLLNILLKEERAIVTPVPGTTRDVIEEVLNFEGIPVRLMDTAGLRKPMDSIELEGVRRTKERIADADIVLLTLDGSRKIDEDDIEIFKEIREKKMVLALNKNDLPLRISLKELKRFFPEAHIVSVSALKKEGIDELKKTIYASLIQRKVRSSPEHLIIANIRHKTALAHARDSLFKALNGIEEGIPFEFIAFDISTALGAIGELVGETTPEEVLNLIFEQFCIGK
jgi:tRNA modification GTPase